MQHKVVTIKNEEGLCRHPALLLTKVAGEFKSHISIECGNKKINAKSVMGVLSLQLMKGDSMHFIADGEDEKQAIQTLAKLVDGGFKE